MSLSKLNKIEFNNLDAEELKEEVITILKQHPKYQSYMEQYAENNFTDFFNTIFSTIVSALKDKIEFSFNNHFASTVYSEDSALEFLNTAGLENGSLESSKGNFTLVIDKLLSSEDDTISLNEMQNNIPNIFKFSALNKNGETIFWEFLPKDNNGEYNYLYSGNLKLNETTCQLNISNNWQYKNKITFYSGLTTYMNYIAVGQENEKISLSNLDKDIQKNSIRVYKIVNDELISMKKVDNFIEEIYDSTNEDYADLNVIPYTVIQTKQDEFQIEFGNSAYTDNKIPQEDDEFIIFYRKGGGINDNISAYTISQNIAITHKINGSSTNTEKIYFQFTNQEATTGGVNEDNPLDKVLLKVQKQKTLSSSGKPKTKQDEDYKVILTERNEILNSVSLGMIHSTNGDLSGEPYYLKSDDCFSYIVPDIDYSSKTSTYEEDTFLNLREQIVANHKLIFEEKPEFNEDGLFALLPANFLYDKENVNDYIFLTKNLTIKETNIWDDFKNYNFNNFEVIERKIDDYSKLKFNAFNYNTEKFWSSKNTIGLGTYISIKENNNNILKINKLVIHSLTPDYQPTGFILQGMNKDTLLWEDLNTFSLLDFGIEDFINIDLGQTYNNYCGYKFKDITATGNHTEISLIDFIYDEMLLTDENNLKVETTDPSSSKEYLIDGLDTEWLSFPTENSCLINYQFTEKTKISHLFITRLLESYDEAPKLIRIYYDSYIENNIIQKNIYFNEYTLSWGEQENNITEIELDLEGLIDTTSITIELITNNLSISGSKTFKIKNIDLNNQKSILPNIRSNDNENYTIEANTEDESTSNTFDIREFDGNIYLKLIPYYSWNTEEEKYDINYNINPNLTYYVNYYNNEHELLSFNEKINFYEIGENGSSIFISYLKCPNIYINENNEMSLKLTYNTQEEDYDSINKDLIEGKDFIVDYDSIKNKYRIKILLDVIKNNIIAQDNFIYANYIKETDNDLKNVISYEDEILNYLENFQMMNIDNYIKCLNLKQFTLKLLVHLKENPYIEDIENAIITKLRNLYSFDNREFGESLSIEQIIGQLSDISNYISYVEVIYFGKRYELSNEADPSNEFNSLKKITVSNNEILVLAKDKSVFNTQLQKYETVEGLIIEKNIIRS